MAWSTGKRKEYLKAWKAANRQHVNAEGRKRNKSRRLTHLQESRDGHRRHHLKYSYGMTLEEYTELLLSQNGVCAVCRQPETALRRGTIKSLDVDHDHATGEIRGLLCSACNTALGMLKDDPLRIRALASYVERE